MKIQDLVPIVLAAQLVLVLPADEPVVSFPAEHLGPASMDAEHLANVVRITPKVISGGQPKDEAAFGELQRWGVKTIISVDGLEPSLELARNHGMRYVHLPQDYKGVLARDAKALTKAVRDLPGPIYIHCHQGKHRAPAAAVIACFGAGMIDRAQSQATLRIAGTSKTYDGLFRSVSHARRYDDASLDAMPNHFPEMSPLDPLALAMGAIVHHYENLQAIELAGWKSPEENPTLEAAHEALLLRERFSELLRRKDVALEDDFLERLRQAEKQSKNLESRLADARESLPHDPIVMTKALAKIANACQTCHSEFR